MTLKEFVANNKKNLAIVVALLLLVGGSFLVGRFSVHVSTETKTTDQKVDTLHVFTQDDLNKAIAVAVQKNEESHVHKVTKEVDKKDGTKVITTTYDKDSKSQEVATKTETIHDTKIQLVDHTVTETKTVDKIVKADLPRFHLSLLAGTDFSALSLKPTSPYIDPILLGLHAEVRVVGPFWLGLLGESDTRFQRKQLLLSVGFQF